MPQVGKALRGHELAKDGLAQGGVSSVTAGTGIIVSGLPANPVVNNAGVLSVAGAGAVTITGTPSAPIVNIPQLPTATAILVYDGTSPDDVFALRPATADTLPGGAGPPDPGYVVLVASKLWSASVNILGSSVASGAITFRLFQNATSVYSVVLGAGATGLFGLGTGATDFDPGDTWLWTVTVANLGVAGAGILRLALTAAFFP